MNKSDRPPKWGSEPEAPEKAQTGAPIAARLSGWFPDLPKTTIDNLTNYHAELLRFNKAVNLISVTTIRNADSVHVADCVLAAQRIEKALIPGEPLFDLGSGNGFPGMVFAILFPKLKVVMVERDSRKAEFLKHIASTLKLENALVANVAIEDLKANSIKNGVARGLAPLHKGMLLTRKQFAKGGKFFHLKGDGWATELAGVPSQLFSFWTPSLLGQYKIPESTSETALIVTEKIAD